MAAQEALRWRYGDVDNGNFALRDRGAPVLVALLLVLVCFVAVCLYLRWACHRYHYQPGAAAVTTSSLPPIRYTVSSSWPSTSSAARGLDDATIAAFPVTMYRPAGGDECCPVCLGEFAEGDKVKALPRCGHGFHPDCVDPWLRARASCPLCRASLLPAAAATKSAGAVGGSEAV